MNKSEDNDSGKIISFLEKYAEDHSAEDIEKLQEKLSSVLQEAFGKKNETIVEERLPHIPKLRPSLGLSMEAMNYFGLKIEPFFMDEISVGLIQSSDLLVKTRGINETNGLLQQFLNDKKSRIVLLEGHRGSGKTTTMNYMLSEILKIQEREGIFPIFCSVSFSKAYPSHEEIKEYLHKALLIALIDTIQNRKFPVARIAEAENISRTDDLIQIDREIRRILYAISMSYPRIILFVDNLDKTEPRNWVEVERYFSSNQDFYTAKLLSGLGRKSIIYIVLATQKWMGTWLVNQVQYMMGGKELVLEEWTLGETHQLFKKRVQWASDRNSITLNSYFESQALIYIHTVNQALPRYIMRAWQQILNKAAEEKVRPVGLRFVRRYRELVKGISLETDLVSNVEILDRRLRRECPRTYRKLFQCLESAEGENVLNVMDTLISIYSNGFSADKNSIDLLLKLGLIVEKKTKKDEISQYTTAKLVDQMLKITADQFGGDIEAISLLLYKWM